MYINSIQNMQEKRYRSVFDEDCFRYRIAPNQSLERLIEEVEEKGGAHGSIDFLDGKPLLNVYFPTDFSIQDIFTGFPINEPQFIPKPLPNPNQGLPWNYFGRDNCPDIL